MLRTAIAATVLALTAVPAFAADYSVAETTIGDLIDNPATKAVLDKVLPGMSDNPQIGMARSMTIKQVQAFAPDQFTDEKLAQIDAELAKITKK